MIIPMDARTIEVFVKMYAGLLAGKFHRVVEDLIDDEHGGF